MQLNKAESGDWTVERDGTLLAQIYMDHFAQVSTLVLFAAEPAERRRIKELFLSHAERFVRHRNVALMGGLVTGTRRNAELTPADSDAQMAFHLIVPMIRELSDEKMDQRFGHPFSLVIAAFPDFVEAVEHIVAEVARQSDIKLSIEPYKSFGQNAIGIRFTATNGTFSFWQNADSEVLRIGRSQEHTLHIVPPYHPGRLGSTRVGLINGATLAYIGHKVIHRIELPGTDSTCDMLGSSLSAIKHPYVTRGPTLGMEISMTQALSAHGADEIIALLLAALEHGGTYASVSGGFRTPYPYPANPRGDRKVRGSEHTCVWQYRTLQAEGKLDGAIIPPWFFHEDWLGAYPEVL